jgi:hypothetical protein
MNCRVALVYLPLPPNNPVFCDTIANRLGFDSDTMELNVRTGSR